MVNREKIFGDENCWSSVLTYKPLISGRTENIPIFFIIVTQLFLIAFRIGVWRSIIHFSIYVVLAKMYWECVLQTFGSTPLSSSQCQTVLKEKAKNNFEGDDGN